MVARALDQRIVEVTSGEELYGRVRLMLLEESDLDLKATRTEQRMRAYFVPPKGACTWRTITPILLPGPLPKRGRAKDAPEAALRADAARRRRSFELAREALLHAGLDPDDIAITRLQMEPFRARELRADADWRLPRSKKTGLVWLDRRPRVHLEISFSEPIPGPLALGDGRFIGLGLFTASNELTPFSISTSSASVETMLLSMATASGNDHALPSIVRALPQAELLHRALISAVTRHGATCSVLSGCDDSGKPLCGPHEHAHILPLDLDGDGHLDHILIWAPMGLDAAVQRAVRAVRRTYTMGGIGPLRLALAGSGTLDELCSLGGAYGDSMRRIVGPSKGSRHWRSLTPFVPPRYMKKSGRNTLEGQVTDELASRGLPAPYIMEIIDPKEDAEILRQRHFIRTRRRGPAPPVDCGFSLKLAFVNPIKGPVCLGYGNHFGLGLFRAVD
jgi:CRISPR-associated protein Csb2